MANDLTRLLTTWRPLRDKHLWVLATIYQTDGSSYRKTGAQMMINDFGRYYGLLSGGCLESDIMQQARRCWQSQKNRLITYDMREEEDLAWQLGIGCGGLVKIILQPINVANDYLDLLKVHDCLLQQQCCCYRIRIDDDEPQNQMLAEQQFRREAAKQMTKDGHLYLEQTLSAPFHLTIVGGGVDARPVTRIAAELGWRMTLIDPRASYARKDQFQEVQQIIKVSPEQLTLNHPLADFLTFTDAIIIMSHNLKIDAMGLQMASISKAKYVGILGPEHRTQRVFALTELDPAQFPLPLANPVGLRLGGELPESIGLSIIAEIHAFLENADAKSISRVVN
jgi:xanthine/CO dehydrogenase XdhC/CoxF family maturation factor